MDASKLISTTAASINGTSSVDTLKAVRIALATAFRDFADEVESGDRVITELQTQESVSGAGPFNSAMFVRSVMKRK